MLISVDAYFFGSRYKFECSHTHVDASLRYKGDSRVGDSNWKGKKES